MKRLRDSVTVKLLLKGIVTREDAQIAVEHGVDGLIVSNHGGRAEESLRSTIESLPEVIEGAAGKIPVLVDGGIRRGTDIFKALALGATAVGIGRPEACGGVWPTRCRGCSRNAASRIKDDHAADRNHLGRQDYPKLRRDSACLKIQKRANILIDRYLS